MDPKLSADERKTLDWIVACSGKAPGGLENISCHSMARMVRNRLGMTQEQLAARVGLPQSHIAKIEKGKVDIQISTMKRIFKALYCSPVTLPRPVKDIDLILKERAGRTAEKNVDRFISRKYGKLPPRLRVGAQERKRLIELEKERLLKNLSSSIWND
mgnify:CR=1 FL=1